MELNCPQNLLSYKLFILIKKNSEEIKYLITISIANVSMVTPLSK